MIGNGGGFCDAVLLVHAYRATAGNDDAGARARWRSSPPRFAPSKERFLETTAQGPRLHRRDAGGLALRRARPAAATWEGPLAYPVAVGVAAAGHDIPLEPPLAAFLHAVAANLVSAGVRLVPLGQTDGQRVLAALEPVIATTASRALVTALDDIGGAAFRADIASMRHETAIHAAVQELTMQPVPTDRSGSASAARSAPARPR